MKSMLAIIIFLGIALALAIFLVVSSMRTSRVEERELLLAQEREHTARLEAERARALRAKWEARFAEDQLLAAETDPRGVEDGLGDAHGPPVRSGRFRREKVVLLPTGRRRG